MTNLNLPQRTFFDFIYACPYAAEPPKIDGNLREWDQHTLVPNLCLLYTSPSPRDS